MNPILVAVLSAIAKKGIEYGMDKLSPKEEPKEEKHIGPFSMGEPPKVPQLAPPPQMQGATPSPYGQQGLTPELEAMLKQYSMGG